jgi:hypothetical protein
MAPSILAMDAPGFPTLKERNIDRNIRSLRIAIERKAKSTRDSLSPEASTLNDGRSNQKLIILLRMNITTVF